MGLHVFFALCELHCWQTELKSKMVQAADVLPLVAKDGALPLIDLGRLALTTSKAIGATISGDNGADPWLYDRSENSLCA